MILERVGSEDIRVFTGAAVSARVFTSRAKPEVCSGTWCCGGVFLERMGEVRSPEQVRLRTACETRVLWERVGKRVWMAE